MFYRCGYSTFPEEEASIITEADCDFLSMLKSYSTREWIIPAMIEGETLQRCGYFKSIPNHLTPVCCINPDKVASVMEKEQVDECDIKVGRSLFLTPAACLHFYPMIKSANVYNEIITTRARVYRYENGNYVEGSRLWDFSVREMVAVGSIEFVQGFLEDLKQKLYSYALERSDNIRVEGANDHFYPSRENEMLKRFQKKNQLKFELIADISGREVALSSFNYHEFHFSKEFDFDNDETIVTGCVGCGLERWLHYISSTKQS